MAGILGMKWGVRKAPNASSSSADHAESRVMAKKKRSEMSTAELQKLAARLELEKKVDGLVAEVATSKGKKAVQAWIKNYGGQVATKLTTFAVEQTVAAVKKQVVKSAASAVV